MADNSLSTSDDREALWVFTRQLLVELNAHLTLMEEVRARWNRPAGERLEQLSSPIGQLQLRIGSSEIALAAFTAGLGWPREGPGGAQERGATPRIVQGVEGATDRDLCAGAESFGKLRRAVEDDEPPSGLGPRTVTDEELGTIFGRGSSSQVDRSRLVSTHCEHLVEPLLPRCGFDVGIIVADLMAHVLVARYADHPPLFRMRQIFARDGIDLDCPTLAECLGKTAALLEPIADAIGQHVLAGQVIFADTTAVRLDPRGSGTIQTARLWGYARDERPWLGAAPPAVWYCFARDRGRQHPAVHLASFQGWMQTDTRAGLREVYASGAIVEVPCMGQIRRRFEDIWRAEACPVASGTLHQIAQLYDVESRARGLPPTLRVELRQKQAAKVFDDLEVRLAMQLTRISGKTALAAAIRYGLARMELLHPYLNCGTLELENNAAERGRRVIDVRGTDRLLVGSEAGGKSAAIAYTLIETAKLNGVDPNLWLADIIVHMARGKAIKVDDLLPWRWNR